MVVCQLIAKYGGGAVLTNLAAKATTKATTKAGFDADGVIDSVKNSGGTTLSGASTAVQTAGGDIYQLIMNAGIVVAMVSLALAFLMLLMGGRMRDDAKGKIMIIMLAVAGLACVTTLVSWAFALGQSVN